MVDGIKARASALRVLSLNSQPSTINQLRGLQPVLPRRGFFTKEIRRLLRGGENGQPS
jgi:hypothetical protein